MTLPMFSQSFQRIAQHVLAQNKSQIKPTIILVHGGWQGPEVFTNLVPCLEKAGYSVFAPRLPSSCTVPALPSFDEDVKAVHSAIQSVIDTGKEVVLAMHSYGAVVGCEALKGLKVKGRAGSEEDCGGGGGGGGVVHLAFISGMILREGESTWKRERGNVPIPGFDFQVIETISKARDGSSMYYHPANTPLIQGQPHHHSRRSYPFLQRPSRTDCEVLVLEVEATLQTVSSPNHVSSQWQASNQSRRAYSSQLTYAAWRYIPSSYLLCTNDNALPLKVQERMVRMAGIQDTSKVDAGHAPHVSQPAVVATFIRKAAGEYLSIL